MPGTFPKDNAWFRSPPRRLFAAAWLAGIGLLPALQSASAQENFYAGKTIRIIVGTGSGGGYDGAARLTARYLGKYIPGNPSFVVENMPGASGIKATNFLYEAAPKDGTVFATVNNSMPVYQAISQPGVRFKAEDLNWIGSLLQTATTISIWHTAEVRTIEEAKRKEVIMGATGAAGTKAAYPQLLNNTLGTKFKIVTGYEGGNTLRLAMERGEVQGDGSARWSSWKSTKPDWVRDNKVIALVQIGLKKDDDLAKRAAADRTRAKRRAAQDVRIHQPADRHAAALCGPSGNSCRSRYSAAPRL